MHMGLLSQTQERRQSLAPKIHHNKKKINLASKLAQIVVMISFSLVRSTKSG